MLLIMHEQASADAWDTTLATIHRWGLAPRRLAASRAISLELPRPPIDRDSLARLPGVQAVVNRSAAYPLVSRATREHPTRIVARGQSLGGGSNLRLIAGPPVGTDPARWGELFEFLTGHGVHVLRCPAPGGEPAPYAAAERRRAAERATTAIQAVRRRHSAALVATIDSAAELSRIGPLVDLVEIPARQMQDYALLKAAGKAGKPVVLHRCDAATLDEWLGAAEYLLIEGNPHVALGEQGTPALGEPRRVLDLGMVARAAEHTHLPLIVDPGPAAESRPTLRGLALAAAAIGADALLLNVEPPSQAYPLPRARPGVFSASEFVTLRAELYRVCETLGRQLV